MDHQKIGTRKETLLQPDARVLGILLLSLSGIIGGCDRFSQKVVTDKREGMIEGVGKAKTVGVVIDPSSGVISAKMSANSPFTQEIQASSDGALKGTVLSFPPGALRLDTEIAVEESIPLASASLAATIGLDGSLTKSSAAVAVLPQVAADPAQPFTVAINLASAGNLRLLAENLVIIYKVKIFAENKTVAGVIPTSAITVDGNTVKFSAQYFGAFQAAYSTVPVTEEKKVEVTTPIQVKREVATLAPLAVSGRSTFVVRPGDTVQLSGQNFRPTMTLALGTTPVKDAKVLSDTSASFTVPSTPSSGVMALTVDQDGATQSVALFYSAAPLAYPVSTLSPSDVCQGTVYYDGTGKQVSGTKPCVVEACSATKTVTCVANDNFPAVDKANLPVDKIRIGTTIAARAGTLGNCAEAGDGCVVEAPFKAADTTNLAPKVVVGQSVAGIPGTTASESHVDCNVEGTVGCVTTASFPPVDATALAAAAWNIRAGTAIAGVPGQLKTNCRNTVNATSFNYDGDISSIPAVDSTDQSNVFDLWDTIDDRNGFSTSNVVGWSSDTVCGDTVWQDETKAPNGDTVPCTSTSDCVYRDRISNLYVTEMLPSQSDWPGAFVACNGLSHGGFGAGSWRLPTQKELMSLYEHGIASVASPDFVPLQSTGFWSASTDATASTDPATVSNAWQVVLTSGATSTADKTASANVICVK